MNADETLESGVDILDESSPLLTAATTKGLNMGSDEQWEHGKEPEWPGQADFEGLPWWKRPSVRYSSTARRDYGNS